MASTDRGRWRVGLGLLGVAVPLVAPGARAHVDYVGPEGPSWGTFWALETVAGNPASLAILVGGTVLAAMAAGLALRYHHRSRDVAALVDVLSSYRDLVPWMLRLSVGLPLVGAGFGGYLFVPVIPTELRIPQVLAGFLLLLGLATRATAAATLAGYLATVLAAGGPALLGFEYVGGLLGIVLVGPGRPSADHMLGVVATREGTVLHGLDPVHPLAAWWDDRYGHLEAATPVAVRLPLGLTFVFLGITQKILDPGPAVALVEALGLPTGGALTPALWVVGVGLVEVGVGLLLVVGLLTRAASALVFLVLTTTLLVLPNDPALAHLTLFGLSSVVFTLGGGPASLDSRWDRREPPGSAT